MPRKDFLQLDSFLLTKKNRFDPSIPGLLQLAEQIPAMATHSPQVAIDFEFHVPEGMSSCSSEILRSISPIGPQKRMSRSSSLPVKSNSYANCRVAKWSG